MTEPLVLTRSDRVLMVAPHPDDETLATGGLLQRAQAAGAEVRVLFATDGENNPWAQRAAEGRWRIGPRERERWGERRRGEALAALECLGVTPLRVAFMGYPDQGLQRLLLAGDEQLIESLLAELRGFRPTFLASPAPDDLHPDHGALAVLIRIALSRLDPREARPREGHYVVHHGPAALGVPALALALTPAERERKRGAILCHASQILLRRQALLAFAEGAEVFHLAGLPLAERPGHAVRRVRLEGDALHLDLERRTRPGAFGATELLLALEPAAPGLTHDRATNGVAGHAHPPRPRHQRRALSGRLPRRPGAFELFDMASGSLVARGEVQPVSGGHGRGGPFQRVTLPSRVLSGSELAFVKLERRFGFFDEAGWRALPCETRVAPQLVPAHAAGPSLEVAAAGLPPATP